MNPDLMEMMNSLGLGQLGGQMPPSNFDQSQNPMAAAAEEEDEEELSWWERLARASGEGDSYQAPAAAQAPDSSIGLARLMAMVKQPQRRERKQQPVQEMMMGLKAMGGGGQGPRGGAFSSLMGG